MITKKEIEESENNSLIVAQFVAQNIKRAMKINNPSAEEILSSLGNTEVIYK